MYQRDLETNYSPSIAAALVEDADFLLTYSIVSMAKNLNFFGQLDVYMKEFARIALSLKNANPGISQRLEQVLSQEIAISTGKDTYYQALSPQDYAPHHNTLAQARFQFLPLAEKALELKKNVAYQQDLDKIRQLRNLLQASGNAELESKLLGSSKEFY